MLACLNESLRCYPPVAVGLPRQAPKGGGNVDGHFVPEGVRFSFLSLLVATCSYPLLTPSLQTVASVFQWASNHAPQYWADPYAFHPERFLPESEGRPQRFATDRQDAMQPFSMGPRNCIGKNLAYAEMRLILAKLVFNFDMAMGDGVKGEDGKVEDGRRWLLDQKVYTLWEKPALNVRLTPVAEAKKGEKQQAELLI